MSHLAARLTRLADRALVAVQTFWLTPCAPDFAAVLRFVLGALALVELAVRWPAGAGGLELTGYVVGLVGMLVGYQTRVFAALAWLGHGAVLGGAERGDAMMQLLLCYLVFSPAGARWSVDAWLGRVSAAPTAVARIAQRAMQLHLCLIHVDAGLDKVQDARWWNGEAIAAALHGAEPAAHPALVVIIAAALMLVELGFVAAIWTAAYRRTALTLAIALQLAGSVLTQQWLLGLTMIAFHLIAFGEVACGTWPSLCLFGFRPRAPTNDDAKHSYPETRCAVVPCGRGDHATCRGG